MRARTGAVNELKAMIVTADASLRAQLRGLRTPPVRSPHAQRSATAGALRFTNAPHATRCVLSPDGSRLLESEIDDHHRALKELLDQAAPQLVADRGVAYVTAADIYIAW